jgi:hypothetical protein
MTKKKPKPTSDKKRPLQPNGQFASKYKPEFDEMLIDHLSKGFSFHSFAGVVRVNYDTVFEWVKRHPSFAEAKQIGTAQSHVFWEKMGIAGTLGKINKFVPSTWIFNMKNRFGWRDRQEIKELGGDEDFDEVISHDKIMEYIEGKKF